VSDISYLAIDLGAESGRLVRGSLSTSGDLSITEVRRWPNRPVRVGDRLHWDALYLMGEIKEGLAAAAGSDSIRSIGVDSWGVDYALLDADGRLLTNPVHYRDERTDYGVAELDRSISRAELYEATGIQFIPINTTCQLAAARRDASFSHARSLLGIPDLFTFWLSDRRIAERTFASTTQLYDTKERKWSRVVLDALEIESALLQELVDPGTSVGGLTPPLAQDTGLDETVDVVAVAAHDTASAVVATPAHGENWAFISSGTWSLVGVEIPKPIITDDAREANFTNEEGFGPSTRFLKNVMGLWLVQECRRAWERRGKTYSYDDLVQMAEEADPLVALIDPDDPSFLRPGAMPERIISYLERTDQPSPMGAGGVVRCILESLALKYRTVLEEAERLTTRQVQVIHVVGGGAQNRFLNQLVADVTGRRVLAGPVEATVMGNIVVQAFADGRVQSIEEMRAAVEHSATISEYVPQPHTAWSRAASRYDDLISTFGA
jgi:rhamnulokinase